MKLLDNLVEKLDNETNNLKRLASETNRRVEELKTAVIQVKFFHLYKMIFFIFSLDIGFT
jgi:hypothetical protein